ncbi:hypothetical protein [Candidatus Neoehrlichia procyonis]|uniref:hypothetical protein n=1 Tax=Candidatus Neoehrlichia procyonis TaxID=467750 RepID=UPI0005F81B5C|nr:hypothetical protein [Candidatus Neoehrlichia lotoris]
MIITKRSQLYKVLLRNLIYEICNFFSSIRILINDVNKRGLLFYAMLIYKIILNINNDQCERFIFDHIVISDLRVFRGVAKEINVK